MNRLKSRAFCSIILSLVFSFTIPSLKAESLSVGECISRVLSTNPNIEAASERVIQAESKLSRAHAATGFFLDGDLGYISADSPSTYLFKTIDSRTFDPATDFNNPGKFSALELGFTARYNLLDGGKRKHTIGQAKKIVMSVEQQRETVINDLIGAVIQTYFSILASEEYVLVANKSLEAIKSQLAEVKVRSEVGGALHSDVLTIEVRLAKGKERLISAKNSVSLAKAAMRQLMDLKPSTPISLSGEEWAPAAFPISMEACIKEAIKLRPELEGLRKQQEAQEEALALAKSGKKPNLDLMGRYSMTDDGANLSMGRDNWLVGAQVSFNIFDCGMNKSTVDEAASGLKELEARKRAMMRQVEVQTEQAFLSLEEAILREQVATINSKRAEESLTLVKEQYESGLVTVTRYLQSEDDRTEALFRSIKSIFDIKKAKAALGNAMGFCAKFAK